MERSVEKHMLKKLKIGPKLIITFLLVALLSSLSGIISLFLLKDSDIKYSNALVNYGFSQGDVGMLMNTFTEDISSLMQLMATDDPALLKQAQSTIQENVTKIDDYMAAIEPTIMGSEEQGYFDALSTHLPELIEHSKDVAMMAAMGDKKGAMELYQTEALSHVEAITVAVKNLMDVNRSTGTVLSHQLTQTTNTAELSLIAVILVAFAVSVVLAIVISLSISRPMGACAQRIVLLSQGDLTTPTPEVKSQDETGVLAQATGLLVKKLSTVVTEMCQALGSMAEGDFTVSFDHSYNGDFAPLQTSTTKILSSLNGALGQITQSADQVAAGSDQVAAGSQALSQGATQQASSVEELAATISQVSTQIKQNADNAAEAKEKAGRVGGEMEESNRQMQDMIAAMENISGSSSEIGKIIKTIEDIAFQTNILALNAAVEAARAGAAGKGFAVVADEVRNLATKSQEASKNTSALIENSIRAVEQGTQIADATAQSLLHAVEGANDVVSTVERISTASNAQAKSIEQITQGVDQIAAVVQTNSATAEESAAASEELSSQAQIMRDLVNQFRLRGDADPAEAPASALPQTVSPARSGADKY